jgi:hypothetical protein
MTYKILYGFSLVAVIFFACNSNNPVTPPVTSSSYNNIFTSESGNVKFELWSATSSTLTSGYNDIGFKVYVNNQKMTSGFVKFFPKMYHTFYGSPMHSTPVSPVYSYNSEKDLFLGYASYNMGSDSTSRWYGWFNYNDVNKIDSVQMNVVTSPYTQIKVFTDNSTETNVYMTLMAPMNPKQGLNDFQIIVHRTVNEINYWEADSLEMFIRTWMPLMGHSSSDNVNPVSYGGGVYKGKVNLNMSGQWYVYDSLRYNNQFITPTPPPRYVIDAP